MPFMGEHRVNWVMAQYRAYRRRNNIGWVLMLISLALILSIGSLAPYVPAGARPNTELVVAVASLGLLGAASRLFNRSLQYYLPQTEDRLLCFLKPAVDSLRAYESYGKADDKKKALKNLRKVASVLEEWTSGNLDFIKKGSVGKTLSDLKENFRRGLLPALRGAKETEKGKLQDILVVLTNMERVVEQTNTIDNEHLEIWNKMLSRYPPVKPPKPLLRKIPAKKSDLSIVTVLVVIPIAVGWGGVAIFNLPIEAGYLGGIAMFGAMCALLLYMQNRKKGS